MSKKNSNVLNNKAFFSKNKNLSKIFSQIKLKLGFLKKKKILVSVSGGPDSLALSYLITKLQNELFLKPYFVHIDHNIRKNSSIEANTVRMLLSDIGIKLNIIKNKKKIIKNIQSNARDIRYKKMLKFCEKRNIKYILTGHHRDDQIETFLIRLSRGSGVLGLSSMKPVSSFKKDKKVMIVRPLLDIKKDDLVKLTRNIFGKYVKDPSNRDAKYLRTKMRNLNRILEKSGIKPDQIIKSIKNLAMTNDTIDYYLSKFEKNSLKKTKKSYEINLRDLREQTIELQYRILSSSIVKFSGKYYPPRSKKIFNILNKINVGELKKQTLGGCIIENYDNKLKITKET